MTYNLFNTNMISKTDPYAVNGLADHFKEAYPKTFAIATRLVGKVPGLFAGGSSDLPAVLASGFDTSVLNQLPWQTRHQVAAEPDAAAAYRQIEAYSGNPGAVAQCAELTEAWARVNAWGNVSETLLSSADKAAVTAEKNAVAAADDDSLYNSLYGSSGVVGGKHAQFNERTAALAAAWSQPLR